MYSTKLLSKKVEPQVIIPSDASFDDEVFIYGKEIYNTILQKVQEETVGDDSKNYINAYLLLNDCEKIAVPLNEVKPNLRFYITCPGIISQIKFTYRFDFIKPGMGIDLFFENYPYGYGRYSVGCLKNPFREEPTQEGKDLMINGLKESLEIVKQANYSKEHTHNKDNFNKHRNVVYYMEAMKYLQQIDPNRTVFPTVEYAVNSVLNSSEFDDYSDKEQLKKFADILEKKAMERLKSGNNAYICSLNHRPAGILKEALNEAMIEVDNCRFDVEIGIDNVKFNNVLGVYKTWEDPILTSFEMPASKESSNTQAQHVKLSNKIKQ